MQDLLKVFFMPITTHEFLDTADNRDMKVRPSCSAKKIGTLPRPHCVAIDKKGPRGQRFGGLQMQVRAKSGLREFEANWGVAAAPQEIME